MAELPEEGELVVVTAHEIHANSVSVTLDEYDDKEAMIHISEVSRSWVRDVEDHIAEGEKTVAQVVDVDNGDVNLSLKRVNEKQKRDKMGEWNKEQKAQKFLDAAAEQAGREKSVVRQDVGTAFTEAYDSIFTGFEQVLLNPGEVEELVDDEELFDAIQSVAEDRMSTKNARMEAELEVTLPPEHGIDTIKDALTVDLENVEVSYVTAPTYKLEAWGVNRNVCRDTMDEAIKHIESRVEDVGGTLSVSKKKN